MSWLTVKLLGGFEVQAGLERPLAVRTKKAQALLAYLALMPGQSHPRDKLASLLWTDAAPGPARNALRQTLFVLRKAIGSREEPALVLTGDAITLARDAVQTDVAAFEQAVAAGTPPSLETAVGLYRGDLLAGLSAEASSFEDWLMRERERLRELAIEALARLLAHERAAGATAAVVQLAIRLLTLDPLEEAVHRTLMRSYAQLGRRNAALRQYQECVEVLRRELAVEPEVETKELYREILQQRPMRAATTTVAVSPTETSLVGRATEMAALRDVLDTAFAGRGHVLAVVGEAGVGKSRLLTELALEAERRGACVLLGRAYESERILPFAPWVGALQDAGILRDPRFLEGFGSARRTELTRLFPELGEPNRPASADPMDPLALVEALAQLLRHLALAQPLIVLLEDVHWADDMTLRFLAYFGRRLHSAPILVAVSVREEDLSDSLLLRSTLDELTNERRLVRVTLAGLGREDTLTLVRQLGRATDAAAERGGQIWAASDGNPFVVVETMRAIGEGVAVEASGSLLLPARVRDMIGRRLDRLSERAQQLVRVAAVIGREFEFALLQRAAGMDETEAAARVEELVSRRVVHGVGERFDFAHERIREVAYSRLLPPRRSALHAAVAHALAELHAADLSPHYGALGRHYREGQAWTDAVTYLRLGGRQAVERTSHHDALVLFERALDALAHVPQSRAAVEAAIDLRLDIADAMLATADAPAILTRLREAESLAASVGDQRRLARALLGMTVQFRILAVYDQSRDAAQRARVIAATLADVGLQVGASTGVAQAAYSVGDYRAAAALFRGNVEATAGHLTADRLGRLQPPSIHSRTWLTWSLAELGDFAEAHTIADDCLTLARSLGYPWALGFAYVGFGVLEIRRGALERAIEVLQPAFELARTWDIPLWLPRIGGALGHAYALCGRRAEGIDLLEQTLQRTARMKVECWRSRILVDLGEAYLLAARPREARDAADSALEVARKHGETGHEAWCLRLLGEIASRDRRADEAHTRFRAALELGTTLGMRPLIAHCHFGLAKLSRDAGQPEQAQEHRTACTTLYGEMGMTHWLEQAESLVVEA